MTEWRKVHQKLTMSPSFAGLPDDFTRLLWVLLPLALDKEGRGIDRTAWIIGQLFPLRDDISPDMVVNALDALEKAGMVVRYTVDSIPYFYAPNFQKYQRTDRQAESQIPAPPTPDLLRTSSGPTPDLLPPRIDIDIDIDIDKNINAPDCDPLTTPTTGQQRGIQTNIQSPEIAEYIYREVTGQVSMPMRGKAEAIQAIYDLQIAHKKKVIPYLRPYWEEWKRRDYRKTNYTWLDWAIAAEIPAPKDAIATGGFSHG